MRGYPTHRCAWCTRMVNFEPGDVCEECRDNYEEAMREKKKREEERRGREYRHPEYRGSQEVGVGKDFVDASGKKWIRVR